MIIEQGATSDTDELAQLYDDLNDFLESGTNYPGWIKGVYPTRVDAENGVAAGNLYVARLSGKIAGSIILSHEPEPVYDKVGWRIKADYSDILVVYTFAVHPAYHKAGIGTALLNFAAEHGLNEQARSIRLDVYENNTPAIRLYEKLGFEYVATVDLGYGKYGLDRFRLYEKLL